MYKIKFHLSDGNEITVDDIVAKNPEEAWREVCQEDEAGYLIKVETKETIHRVFKGHLVSIETKDKSASSRKNTETAMTAIDALSNMGL